MDPYGKEFALAFVPLFVAVDPVGNLGILLGLTEGVTFRQRLRIIYMALATAIGLGISFLFAGKAILRFLDIEVGHFAIAGGLVLLIVAVRDLAGYGRPELPERDEMMAIVPIGTPLLAGPATLATLLILNDQFNEGVVVPAYFAIMAVALAVFTLGNYIAKVLGRGGLRAVSKVASLLLAAIAVRLIVVGIDDVFQITA